MGSPARREILRNQLYQELSKISTANGYNTDPAEISIYRIPPADLNRFPLIYIQMGDEVPVSADTNKIIWDTFIQVTIVGWFQELRQSTAVEKWAAETAGEPLLQDIKKVLANLAIDNAASTVNKWTLNKFIRIQGPVYDKINIGWVSVTVECRIWAQDTDF